MDDDDDDNDDKEMDDADDDVTFFCNDWLPPPLVDTSLILFSLPDLMSLYRFLASPRRPK